MGFKIKVPDTVASAAEYYASQFKWRVFPLYEMLASGVCSCSKGGDCKTPGKHPRVSIPTGEAAKAGHPATSDVEQIKKWWKKWPNANIGVWLEGSDLIVLDIDRNEKKDGFKGLAEIMAYEQKTVEPWSTTLTCETPSSGKHLYYRFREGVPNKANALGPGLDTWHSQHYVIVPPSNHWKGKLYEWAPDVIDIEPYPDWLMPKQREEAPERAKGPGRPTKEKLDVNDPDDVDRFVHALSFVDGTNRDLWVMCGFAIARAFDWSDAGFAIYDEWSAKAHNYDAQKTREQYYKQSRVVPSKPITTASIFEWARQHIDYKPWENEDDRPYEIRERPSDELSTLIEMSNVLPEFPIYQRGPKLVEIIPVNKGGDDDVGIWRPKGTYILREVTAEQLASRILPAKVKWLKKMAKGWKAHAVSKELSSTFVNIGNWPKAKKLRAFVQHPTLRDDGSLLSAPGYDSESGMFLTEAMNVNVPDKPTKADATIALAKLLAPFAEFRWVDGRLSLTALAAAIFTVGIRHLFNEGVPLFAIDAPRPGAGKSKLVKAISILWFGREPATTPYSNDHEEMKKHLAAMLLNGDRIVLFDNVHPMIRVNDPTLNAMLTSGRVTFRELGSQRMLEMDAAVSLFITGNTLKIVGDMIRRTIRMQIDPGGLQPHLRKFKIDPLEGYVLQHRRELIEAALTVLRAYFAAGKPKASGQEPPIASFESWSNIVRELLIWLEMDDVRECITTGYEQDDESNEIEHLVRLLYDIPELSGDGLSSAQILPLIDSNKKLKDALLPFVNERSGISGIHHPRVITTALSQVSKIPIDGKRLLRLGPVWVIREEEQ